MNAASLKTAFPSALNDVLASLRRLPNYYFLAMMSVKLRYRRSILGPLWITITTGFFIFFIGYLYSGIVGVNFHDYLLSLALAWIIWQFISDAILAGGRTFRQSARIIQTTYLEKFSFVLITVLRNLITFAHNLLIAVLVFAVVGIPFSAATWLVIPGFALIVLSAISASTLFGLLCARYRDIYPLLQASTRVLFFVTPILWSPSLLPEDSPRRLIADLNPFAHYVAVWRAPLMGQYPDLSSWLVTGGCTAAGLAIAFCVFAIYRQKIVFWV